MSNEEDTSGVNIHLEEQFTIEALSNKITNTLSVINTGKKITKGIVQNILLLWDEKRTDFSTPRGEAVVRFRKAFLFKVNNRAKMLEMPMFKLWEDAIEVMTGDIDNPFLGDIRDTSKLSLLPQGIYVGELQDGKPCGKGIMVFREEWSFYKGMWKNGLYHGVGTVILKRNKKRDIYEGEWKNGLKHGNGKLIHIDNLDPYGDDDDECYVYNGNWKEGTKHGVGKIIEYSHITDSHPIERVYEGEWKNDFYHGKGRFFARSGDIYTGDFCHGNR